ncbi:MAG: hypothetical protein IKD04_00210 [Clostridia bacterium]|nr:hypothetical protein [Clostridia bacterium]
MFNFSLIEEAFPAISGAILTIYGITLTFSGIVGLILYILRAFGIYDMSKTLGVKGSVLAFIPVLNVLTFGRVAQKYQKKNGTKSAKLGAWLLILYILVRILLAVFILLSIFAVSQIIANVENAVSADSAVTFEMFSSLIPVIAVYFVALALAVVYEVVYYVSLWRIFAIFTRDNATTFTVLSVLFGFLAPIFLFIHRKNAPQSIQEPFFTVE